MLRMTLLGGAVLVLLTSPLAAAAGACGPAPSPEECQKWKCMSGDGWWELLPDPTKDGTSCQGGVGFCKGGSCSMPSTGAIFPAYYVASVTYSPPGVASFVEYGTGSKVGTTTSTTWAWEASVTAEYKAGLSLPLVGGSTSFSFSRVWGSETTNSTDVVVSTGATSRIRCDPVAGTCSDYINHNDDQILILFGTKINVLAYASATGLPAWMPQVRWGLDFSQVVPLVLKVGWLNGAESMPTNVASALSARGVGVGDYGQILKTTPFAADPSGVGALDPDRFELVTVFPYEPTLPNSYTWTTENNYTSSDQHKAKVAYSVGATWTGTVLSNELIVSGKHTWSNASSTTNTQSDSSSLLVQVGMPSDTYLGPTNVYVYLDKVYKTLMFSFVGPY